jgi:hypothetical protein
MVWFILSIEKYGGIDQINMTAVVHVEVSRAKRFGVTIENKYDIY